MTGESGYYQLGDELPAERFAAFRPARLVGTGRLQERYFVGEQGVALREHSQLWDTMLGQLCTFDLTSSGRRCVPTAWSGQFADNTCSTRAGAAASPPCGAVVSTAATAMLSTVAPGTWCAPQAVPAALGTSIDPQAPGRAFTRFAGGSCTVTNFLDGGDYRRFGDPVPLDMFAPGTEAMD